MYIDIRQSIQRSKRRKKKGKVNVIAPQVQQAYGVEPQSAQGQLETSYLLFLTLVFVFIILEGLFIALSVRAPLSCLVHVASILAVSRMRCMLNNCA